MKLFLLSSFGRSLFHVSAVPVSIRAKGGRGMGDRQLSLGSIVQRLREPDVAWSAISTGKPDTLSSAPYEAADLIETIIEALKLARDYVLRESGLDDDAYRDLGTIDTALTKAGGK
jgi:hypothetical protein